MTARVMWAAISGGSPASAICVAWRLAFGMALLLAFPQGGGAEGACQHCTATCREQDQMWLVDTRHVGCVETEGGIRPGDAERRMGLLRFDSHAGWAPSSWREFSTTDDPKTATRIWIHGNRIRSDEALDAGFAAYRAMVADDSPPVRFVIWSWPSDKLPGQRRDVQWKAERTRSESYYLAWLIDRIDARVRVGVVGYSFGARIATGALHLAGGGDLDGLALADRSKGGGDWSGHQIRVVLLAAAIDTDWLARDAFHGRALSQVEGLYALYNPGDRVLGWYGVALANRGVQPLGKWGAADVDAEDAERYQQEDVRCLVGAHHVWTAYLRSDGVAQRMRDFLSESRRDVASARPTAAICPGRTGLP